MAESLASAIIAGDARALAERADLRECVSQPLRGHFARGALALTDPLPLQLAALFGQQGAAYRLLDAGADPNAAHPEGRGALPMHLAVALGDAPLIRLLHARGASLELADGAGLTPLHAAVLHADAAAFQELVNLGANVAAVDPAGDTVIHAAIRRQRWLLVQYLEQTPAYAGLRNAAGVPAAQLIRVQAGAGAGAVAVDARRYAELRERVVALEFALARVAAARSAAAGACPVCGRRFEGAEWAQHVRAGCRRA
jgi:hypothetical protein